MATVFQPVAQPLTVTTTRPDTNFQWTNNNQPQVHNANAPAGNLARIGSYFCGPHQKLGARCRMCEDGGCEWKAIFDPIGLANPNIPPLRSYGEMLTDKYGPPQRPWQEAGPPQSNDNRRFNNNNGRYRRPPQNQYTNGNGSNNVQYHPPPPQNNLNSQLQQAAPAVASGSGNA